MYKYKISYEEYSDYAYVDIYHTQKFSKEEFFMMYKEAFNKNKIENDCGRFYCNSCLEDYFVKHFGFTKTEETYEINTEYDGITFYDRENSKYYDTDTSSLHIDFSKESEEEEYVCFY